MSLGSSQPGSSTSGWSKTSSESSASVPDMGHYDRSHEVVTTVEVENLRRLSFKINTSGSRPYVQPTRRQKLNQRRPLRVAVLTIQAILRLDHRLRLQPPKASSWYEDPITSETMCDPVKCNDGITYDRWTLIDNTSMAHSPYTRRPLAIAADDINVRGWVFDKYPEQALKFCDKRNFYRAKALQHLRYHPLEFDRALEMLNHILKWAPEDIECEDERSTILSYVNGQTSHLYRLPLEGDIVVHDYNGFLERNRLPHYRRRSHTSSIPVISHDDIIRERYGEARFQVIVCLILVIGVCGLPSTTMVMQRGENLPAQHRRASQWPQPIIKPCPVDRHASRDAPLQAHRTTDTTAAQILEHVEDRHEVPTVSPSHGHTSEFGSKQNLSRWKTQRICYFASIPRRRDNLGSGEIVIDILLNPTSETVMYADIRTLVYIRERQN